MATTMKFSQHSHMTTTPVFEDLHGKVYHGDFRAILPHLKFDYIFTDPPYNVRYKYPNYPDNLTLNGSQIDEVVPKTYKAIEKAVR